MSFVSCALRVATPRCLPAPWRSPRPLSSAAGPTAEKSVPYQRTLKEEGSGEPSRPPPSSAEVVVVGGGSLGCQTTYHLAKQGVTNVVLLERDRLTSGTTWHTAGLLWQLRPSDVEVELLAHTREVVSRELPAETGLHTGWVQNGGLFIASSKQRLDEYKRLMSNMPNVRDHDASVYLRLQGDALSVGGYESNPIFWEEVSEKFAFGLFDLNWDVFMQHIEGAINRVPVLERTGIKSTVCGPESFTADHKPLMGEAPEVRGFFLGCGFNSAGMMLGGGCGKELAHWIIHGRPEKDMHGYDIRRFHHSLTDNNRWIRERSHESYAKNYSVVFPHDEPLAGRNLRKDPLHEELLRQGCVFQERHGWERPGWFSPGGAAPVLDYDYYGAYGRERHRDYIYNRLLGDEYTFDFPPHHDIIKKECLACRNALALFDMSYFGKFYLLGPEATKAVNWLFTADVSKAPGSTVYTCMLNKQGGVESDLTVSRISPEHPASPLAPAFEGDGYYLAIGGAVAQHNWSHITTVLQDMKLKCKLLDCSEELGMMSIQGPLSRVVLQEVLDTDLSNEAFPFSTHKLTTAAGCKVRAMRLSFVGELGWELHVPRADCVKVYQALMRAGARHGIANAGYRAIDSLSSEKGYRHWHADLRSDDTPLEAGLAFTCKLKSNIPFLGREAVEAQKAKGIFRRLVCFTAEQKVPMFGLEAVWRDGKVVGHIRRADFGFAIDKTIAYGYIRDPAGGPVSLDFVKSGSYQLERMGETFPAQAHTKSPFDPDNKRVKGFY
ncbi:sarcosine dehydrogenase, mitochondrial isoform X3 [Pogoniulus pusillus]|uniref:sarcosine dehydrogenase, mitochondrial isoform X3 n=1 Tax=Pogoniulus pusillus TaxID=488313 RepID=UPI0030B97908